MTCRERIRLPVGWAVRGHQWEPVTHETVTRRHLYAHDCERCTECGELKCIAEAHGDDA